MKKLQVLIVAAGIAGSRQLHLLKPKLAYIRMDDIVGVMPELAPEKVNMDTVGQQFTKDSIKPEL